MVKNPFGYFHLNFDNEFFKNQVKPYTSIDYFKYKLNNEFPKYFWKILDGSTI